MATIGTESNGRRRILFVAGDGKRKTVRLGKVSQRQAEAFKARLEVLVGRRITGTLDDGHGPVGGRAGRWRSRQAGGRRAGGRA